MYSKSGGESEAWIGFSYHRDSRNRIESFVSLHRIHGFSMFERFDRELP